MRGMRNNASCSGQWPMWQLYKLDTTIEKEVKISMYIKDRISEGQKAIILTIQ